MKSNIKNRKLLSIVALPVMLFMVTASASAQNYNAPRTPWGDPDLQGVYTSDDSIGVRAERPEEFGDRLFLTEEEYNARLQQNEQSIASRTVEFAGDNPRITINPPGHWLEWGDELSRQTSLVVDPPNGRIPEVTSEAQERTREYTARVRGDADSWENFSPYIRCITRGATGSIFPVIYGNGTRIVQGQGYVGLMYEMVHEARIVPLVDAEHVGSDIMMWAGDAIGYWEDDTLVVETRNLTNKTGVTVNGGGTRHSENLHIVERFTRVAPDRINYEATFTDPDTWAAPWTAAFPIKQKPGYEVYEYACHEGNHAMFNSLSGARADEAAAAAENNN